MSDEGFHEIQLNGKQLVFLFMATTVVVVVIFLCGVLVGRGVRGERMAPAGDASTIAAAEVMPDPRADKPATVAASTPEPAAATPPAPADEDLSYYKRLEGDKPPTENLKSPTAVAAASKPATKTAAAAKSNTDKPSARASEKPAGKPAADKPVADKPVAVVATARPAASAAARPTGEPAGDGFAVQIAALREKSEADGIVKRLSDKGYQAYVMPPPSGKAAAVYRVRVGKFQNRRDAEVAAGRLEKEEQFKPWIIR